MVYQQAIAAMTVDHMPSEPEIQICICFDENLVVPAGVLIHSIGLALAKDRQACIHVCHPQHVDLACLVLAAQAHPAVRLVSQVIDEAQFKDIRIEGYPYATLYRLGVEAIDVAKIVFIDVDTLVLNDLSLLYDLDLEGHYVAACRDLVVSDLWLPGRFSNDALDMAVPDYLESIVGLAAPSDYFNAGVMVMDLDRVRQLDLRRKCMAFCTEQTGLVFFDQDALNHFIGGRFLRLDPRWNAFAAFADRNDAPANARETVADLWATDPWIVHFTGKSKPWQADHARTMFDATYLSFAESSRIADRYREFAASAPVETAPPKIVTPRAGLLRRLAAFWAR